MNKDKPTLSVSFTEPVQSCKVLDTVAGNPLGYNLFVKGELSGWNAQPQYQLSYKGMDGDLAIYQAASTTPAAPSSRWPTRTGARSTCSTVAVR